MANESQHAGLYAGDAPVPLIGVAVEATLEDFCSRVVVSQRFRNEEKKPIEAVYVFPVDATAAVCAFEAIVGETRVVGRVEEREKAFEQYDEAMAAGHGAFLLDQERRDVFTASIGNVLPGQEVTVRITYVAETEMERDRLRFAIPTTVSPRYAPDEDRSGVGRPPAEALNPPVALSVPYGLTLDVRLQMSSPIRSIESPSHPIACEIDGTRATVRLAARETALDRDFVLSIGMERAEAPRAWVEVDPQGRRVAVVSLTPEFESAPAPCEVVFVVDRSGSMQGSSIAEARNALQLCLRSLPAGSYFNIVGFGSTFEMLFPQSRAYDEASLEAASKHVSDLHANLGGTEVLPALESVLAGPPVAGLSRQILLMTDGQVTNTEQVIKLIRERSAATRVFAFGIGHGASHALVRGIARAGSGAAEFITPGERLEAKVVRQLGRALAPGLTDVRVDWGGLRVRQAPHRLPAVFAGGRSVIYGFIEDGAGGPSDVRLNAVAASGAVSFAARLDPERARAGTLAATLGANAMIRDLEDGVSALHEHKGSRQERGRASQANIAGEVKAEIVRLGIAYSLCSRETSFVAIEERESPASGEAQLRRIPVALTHGWGEEAPWGTAQQILPKYASVGTAAALHRIMGEQATPPRGLIRQKIRSLGIQLSSPREAPRRPIDELIALQLADGSWELSDELVRFIGIELEACAASTQAYGNIVEARRALATGLALAWLEKHASDRRDEWSLLALKADAWLAAFKARTSGEHDWRVVARPFVS